MSRACRVLGACAALRRRGVEPPFLSTWTRQDKATAQSVLHTGRSEPEGALGRRAIGGPHARGDAILLRGGSGGGTKKYGT